jgi:hypothetical protein
MKNDNDNEKQAPVPVAVAAATKPEKKVKKRRKRRKPWEMKKKPADMVRFYMIYDLLDPSTHSLTPTVLPDTLLINSRHAHYLPTIFSFERKRSALLQIRIRLSKSADPFPLPMCAEPLRIDGTI